MTRPRIAIIADDLTGALDAAAPFAGIAGGVVAATSSAALPRALARGAGVLAVSTRSREIGGAAARDEVARVLSELPQDLQVVKKVDSRLKGNIASELAAFGDRRFLVLPAIPDFGRIVLDGALQGFGVQTPVSVRDTLGHIAAAATVPDTRTQDDMLAAIAEAPGDVVLVGARGLAQALAGHLGLGAPRPDPVLPRPICFAVGSTDPITAAQVACLRSSGAAVRYIACPSGQPGGADPCAQPAELTLLQATEDGQVPPTRVARDFADTLAPHLAHARAMLLTGGATAEAALDALGIDILDVRGEALPGLPLCCAGGQAIITKSGGFGPPDTFLKLAGLPAAIEA